MFKKTLCGALCALALAIVPICGAWATNDPIPDIDIIIKTTPNGIVIIHTTTNAKGEFTLKVLGPGKYILEVRGKNIGAAKADEKAPWIIALQAISRAPASSTSQTYTTKAGVAGIQQVEIVISDGPARSYTGTLTR